MNVYIVEGRWDYEPGCILGVYSDREDALKRKEADENSFDRITIKEYEVE